MYSTLCVVKGDTTEICKSLQPQVGAETFYKLNFKVVLALGLTELKAYICWEENVSSHTNLIDFDSFYLPPLTRKGHQEKVWNIVQVADGVNQTTEIFFFDRSPAEVIYDSN